MSDTFGHLSEELDKTQPETTGAPEPDEVEQEEVIQTSGGDTEDVEAIAPLRTGRVTVLGDERLSVISAFDKTGRPPRGYYLRFQNGRAVVEKRSRE